LLCIKAIYFQELAKYGIKIFSTIDCGAFYTLNTKLYVRTQPDDPFKENKTPPEIVKRLSSCQPEHRNIITDNWYTSECSFS
jgi:hypothetical protein